MASPPGSPDMPSYMVKRWEGDTFWYLDTRLESGDDPTPRESEYNVDDLHEAFVEACRRTLSSGSSVRLTEEQIRQREEHDRKSLKIALEVYTKRKKMQPTELEFLEVKERNLIDERGKGFLHFNFLLAGLDGKHTMFFAEVHHDLIDENDVYVCTPLGEEDDFKHSKENGQDHCIRIHPSCGSFLGGHKYIAFPRRDNYDEEYDEDIGDAWM